MDVSFSPQSEFPELESVQEFDTFVLWLREDMEPKRPRAVYPALPIQLAKRPHKLGRTFEG
jgi:hypothetical protein